VPDGAVFQNDRIPRQANGRIANKFEMAPDWTICTLQRYANEILAPDQSHSKVIRNILHCLQHGTVMGWLIDPEESCVFTYDASGRVQAFELDQPDAALPTAEFAAAFKVTVGELFNWLVL
jgi:Uma2 family endonuclease